jgi:hypothetical protein
MMLSTVEQKIYPLLYNDSPFDAFDLHMPVFR